MAMPSWPAGTSHGSNIAHFHDSHATLPSREGESVIPDAPDSSLDHLSKSRRQCTTRHVPSVHPFDWVRDAVTISDRNRFLMPASSPNSSFSLEVEASGLAPAAKPPLFDALSNQGIHP